MKKLLCIVGISMLAASVAQAATYTWTGVGSNTRMSTAENWDAGTPANANDTDWVLADAGVQPGSTYNNFTVRSITFSNNIDTAYGFGINRSATRPRDITLSSSTGTSTITVQSGAEGDISITGTMATDQNAFILNNALDVVHNGTGNLTLGARITGAYGITKSGTGTLRLNSANNDYTGNTVVSEGKLTLLDGGQLLFNIGTTGVNNGLTGSGQAAVNGNFLFDLASAGTTLGDSWQIVDVTNLNESFHETTFNVLSTVGSFAGSSGVWTISENGTEYEFSESTGALTVIPEPATLGMIAASGFGVLFIRRRFMM